MCHLQKPLSSVVVAHFFLRQSLEIGSRARKARTFPNTYPLARVPLMSVEHDGAPSYRSPTRQFGYCAPVLGSLSVTYITDRVENQLLTCKFWEGEKRRASGATDNIHKTPSLGPAG